MLILIFCNPPRFNSAFLIRDIRALTRRRLIKVYSLFTNIPDVRLLKIRIACFIPLNMEFVVRILKIVDFLLRFELRGAEAA